METLGSLIDKLSVVRLKQYHTHLADRERHDNLSMQELDLVYEISDYLRDAISGKIPKEKLSVKQNKIHIGMADPDIYFGNIGNLMSMLAQANCEIWHCQEKLYNFKAIPAEEKDGVVESISRENLKRTRCIEGINIKLQEMINNGK
jgi:hypothetical protein